jgi:hypothetical protein
VGSAKITTDSAENMNITEKGSVVGTYKEHKNEKVFRVLFITRNCVENILVYCLLLD